MLSLKGPEIRSLRLPQRRSRDASGTWGHAMKHSYADEIRPPREPIEPIIVGWWDVLSLIAQVILCGAAVVAVFLVLFLWAGAIVEAP